MKEQKQHEQHDMIVEFWAEKMGVFVFCMDFLYQKMV